MKTISYNVYTIDEHPSPELCYEWIRDNWHDLNQFSVDELIMSLKTLSDEIGGELDYGISQVPDRGEYIKIKNYDEEILNNLNADDCPLTGSFWDAEIIEGLRENNLMRVLDLLHDETEYVYSNEGLYDLCLANEYEFTIDGKFN